MQLLCHASLAHSCCLVMSCFVPHWPPLFRRAMFDQVAVVITLSVLVGMGRAQTTVAPTVALVCNDMEIIGHCLTTFGFSLIIVAGVVLLCCPPILTCCCAWCIKKDNLERLRIADRDQKRLIERRIARRRFQHGEQFQRRQERENNRLVACKGPNHDGQPNKPIEKSN